MQNISVTVDANICTDHWRVPVASVINYWNSSLKGSNRVLNQSKGTNLNYGSSWVCGVVWNDIMILDQFKIYTYEFPYILKIIPKADIQ